LSGHGGGDAKVLVVGTNVGKLAFALEQDPRIIVHVAADASKSRDYQIVIQPKPGQPPDVVRRQCARDLKLSPLSFDPPAALVEFAIPRDGAQWQPPAR